MSTGVINPTNESFASKQVINMISGNVGNPRAYPIGGYYPPGGANIVSSTCRKAFWWTLPYSRGETPAGNYFKYAQMPQTSFGQPIMPQPTFRMPYPILNTIGTLINSQFLLLLSAFVSTSPTS